MDLIERLRYGHGEQVGITDEAADELERLQAQITAMTKDMDSLEKQLDMADAAIERWKAENEELRKSWSAQCESADKLFDELAALKAQSTEQPVAWYWEEVDSDGNFSCADTGTRPIENEYRTNIKPLYLAPPTAAALVEDFKRKIVWMLDTITADVRFQSKDCYRMADQLRHYVESLPLIQGEKHE